ncbi:MAG: P1 family peptidase, partial [Chloroflexota bacterium]
MDKMQLREWGVAIGQLPTGTQNAITDVEGVKVGHHTLNEGDNIRTGVTAILPHGGNLFTDKVMGAVHRINGFGKACGFEQVRELGTIETPILLTSTLNVGKVADVCITY